MIGAGVSIRWPSIGRDVEQYSVVEGINVFIVHTGSRTKLAHIAKAIKDTARVRVRVHVSCVHACVCVRVPVCACVDLHTCTNFICASHTVAKGAQKPSK